MEKKSSKNNQNSLLEQIKLMKTCPLCSKEYATDSISVVEEAEGTKLMHLTCLHCHNAMLALLVTSKLGVSSVGMMTDLTASDAQRFYKQRPIDEDDILRFHECLKHEQQDFIHFLTR